MDHSTRASSKHTAGAIACSTVERSPPRARAGSRGPVIYLDTSVALAQLLAEDRMPPPELWNETLVSSRLIEYEIWTRIHARKLSKSHGEFVRTLLGRLALIELAPPVLARALEPFPTSLRTLDALHLASAEFLRTQGQSIRLATYDARMKTAAKRLGIPLYAV